jgi:acyl-CoA thioester hydrolase
LTGETQIRVRYAETDQMGVAYHSNFVIWLEVGRVELLRQSGFEYKRMEQEDDCHLPVVDLRLRFKSPARYDDLITVRTTLAHIRGPLMHFRYELLASDGTLLAEGETTHIITNSRLEKRSLPQKYLDAFQPAANSQ